jgi:DNA repair exonuclease SbcCD ATPase subunit
MMQPALSKATLRVPADQLDAAATELKSLGRAESESQSGEEVTQQCVELDARLTNANNTEQRLTDLLRQRTGKLADALAVEKQIDQIREKIERMEAENKSLGKRIDFALPSG